MAQLGFTAAEIIETGRISANQIGILRSWLVAENLPELSDAQLILFSLSCFNNVDDTRKTIKAYVSTKNDCPALFTNRNVLAEEMQQQLTVVNFCVFPVRTADDQVVMYHGLKDTNFRHYDMRLAMKLLFMTLDAAVYDHPPQGLVIIFDMKGVSLWHLTRIKFALLKVFFQYLQEALPVRLAKIHVLNSVYFLEKVIDIIKPFIKKEVMDLITFHPSDMAVDLLPQEYLPKDLGGTLPEIGILHAMNIAKLKTMQDYFDA